MTIDVTRADRDAAAHLMELWEDGTLHCDDFVEVIAQNRIAALDHLTAQLAAKDAEIAQWRDGIPYRNLNLQIGQMREALAARDKALATAIDWLKCTPLESGYCCCGSPVESHGMGDGHSPVDELSYSARLLIEELQTALTTTPATEPAPCPGCAERDKAIAEAVNGSSFTYKARNGRDCYIEDDSGERCVLVPHDAWIALQAFTTTPATEAYPKCAHSQWEPRGNGWMRCLACGYFETPATEGGQA